ncbi:hypothetical protein BON22_2278 [Cyberlindnera fabianii]|uniref:Uncharacterized protein n=1 Tax=Cyberlindnera fabianii TaxID=36022 RepID=A0A1V2L762_CYBFA|nr:hypothetical protein BON22_2278 [Cyberlindnera fabianii]
MTTLFHMSSFITSERQNSFYDAIFDVIELFESHLYQQYENESLDYERLSSLNVPSSSIPRVPSDEEVVMTKSLSIGTPLDTPDSSSKLTRPEVKSDKPSSLHFSFKNFYYKRSKNSSLTHSGPSKSLPAHGLFNPPETSTPLSSHRTSWISYWPFKKTKSSSEALTTTPINYISVPRPSLTSKSSLNSISGDAGFINESITQTEPNSDSEYTGCDGSSSVYADYPTSEEQQVTSSEQSLQQGEPTEYASQHSSARDPNHQTDDNNSKGFKDIIEEYRYI